MESKKTKKADLESSKGLFIQLGLVAILALIWVLFEWKTYDKSEIDTGTVSVRLEDEDVVVTQMDNTPPPPPPPPPAAAPEQIVIVENEAEVEEVTIESAETSSRDIVVVEVPTYVEEVEEVFPFAIVENKPVFPGCEKHKNNQEKADKCFSEFMNKHIQKNQSYPVAAQEMGIQGRVLVKLTIGKDGNITAEIARGVDRNLDAEALRVLNKLPRMEPAKQRDKPVAVTYIQPIYFKLQQ